LIENYGVAQHDPLEQFGLVLDDRYDDRLVVWKVIPRTPAYYAGVRAQDVITALNDQRVTSKDELEQDLQNASEGEAVRLTVYRGQQPRHLEAEIAKVAARETESRTVYRPQYESDPYYDNMPTYGSSIRPNTPATTPAARPALPRPGILPRNR